MTAKGVFVDDEDNQYAALLSTPGVLEFVYQLVTPIMDQAEAVRAAAPTIVALDYRLDEVTPGIDAAHTYKGSALAQVLRDKAIAEPESDFAIVLVSNEMKLKALYAPDKTAHDLFDLVYSKEDVTRCRDEIRLCLQALSAGYEKLRGFGGQFDAVTLLNAKNDECERLSAQEIATAFKQAAAPHIVSKIILRSFIDRPGLLVNDTGAAALCGVDPANFGPVAELLVKHGADYTGIFAAGWRRWWTNRIEAWGESVMGHPLLSMTSAERAQHISRVLGQPVAAARSPWNGRDNEFIAFACAACHRPTELRHSLAAFDPKSPRFATRRRICWDCIQTDRYIEENILVDESDADLVSVIMQCERQG